MPVIVSFIGPSNSGKTSLIDRLVRELITTHRVCVIKNDPSDKAEFDRPGKDSFKFFQAGADVFVTSPRRTTFFAHYPSRLKDLLPLIKEYDLVLVEGMRYLQLPTIAVFHKRVEEDYLPFANAYTVRDGQVSGMVVTAEYLDYTDTSAFIRWILQQEEYRI